MKLDCGAGGRLSLLRSGLRGMKYYHRQLFFFSTSLSKVISEGARQQPRHLAM